LRATDRLFGLERILDGIEALVRARARPGDRVG
jgi:hypothetical protein